jgi:hypothetical protein
MSSPLQYELSLNTGEIIHISEIDPEVFSELRDANIVKAISSILDRCTKAPRDVLELAKIGGTKQLEGLLSTSPTGCLIKIEEHICAEKKDCPMANSELCSTRKMKKGKPKIPHCWKFNIDDKKHHLPYMEAVLAQHLATAIIHEWRDGRYVIIVQ